MQAVKYREILYVKYGSIKAISGNISSCETEYLTLFLYNTAKLVASLPVPAVVGITIKGNRFSIFSKTLPILFPE